MSEEEISLSELILNNYALYFVVIVLSALVLVDGEINWIITSVTIVFLHIWIYGFDYALTSILPKINFEQVPIEIVGILPLFYFLPKACVILFTLSYLIIRVLGFGKYISDAINFIIFKDGAPNDLNNFCIPVMFATIMLNGIKY